MKYFLFFLPFFFLSSPKYGPEYNSERIKRGIPIIEDGWKMVKIETSNPLIDDSVTWVEWEIGVIPKKIKSYHNGKAISLKDGKLKSESDDFIHILNRDSRLEVNVDYDYEFNSWFAMLSSVTGCKRNKLSTQIDRLSLPQADSILASWGLSRTGEVRE